MSSIDGGALDALLPVARALRSIGAPFLVGGSFASSLQGIPRSTRDIDLVVDLDAARVPEFCRRLRPRYYLDEDRIRHGVERRSSFNVIDLTTGFKVDIYLSGSDAFAREQFLTLQSIEVVAGESLPFASPEQVVLQKLRWYRLGGEVSERQWLDVLGVLKVQEPTIDRAYLDRWAAEIGVGDLLVRACEDAGYSPDR